MEWFWVNNNKLLISLFKQTFPFSVRYCTNFSAFLHFLQFDSIQFRSEWQLFVFIGSIIIIFCYQLYPNFDQYFCAIIILKADALLCFLFQYNIFVFIGTPRTSLIGLSSSRPSSVVPTTPPNSITSQGNFFYQNQPIHVHIFFKSYGSQGVTSVEFVQIGLKEQQTY